MVVENPAAHPLPHRFRHATDGVRHAVGRLRHAAGVASGPLKPSTSCRKR